MNKYVVAIVALLATTFGASAMAWGGRHGGDYRHSEGYFHGDHWGSHSRFGFYIGMPLIWPRVDYYPDYYRAVPYYPTTQVIVERQPQVYVQREAPAAQVASNYWYYCPDSRTYYPYAQTCPSPWLQVVPQTSPQVPR